MDTTHGKGESSLLYHPDEAVDKINSLKQHIKGNVVKAITFLIGVLCNAGSKKERRHANRCKTLLV